jgi:hypothetical protein
MDPDEEVYMLLDRVMTDMCMDWMPEMKEFVRPDGKLAVKVDKAMYGLIQLAKLWYKELTKFLEQRGFKKCPLGECVLMKKTDDGEYIVLLLYVDDILIMSKLHKDKHWVKGILEAR